MTHAISLGTRAMRLRPWSSVHSVLCLALGMAASAAAFTLIDATALRPFGLPRSGDLVVVWESDPTRPQDLIEVSLLNFSDWQRQATTLESMAAFGSSHWPGIGRIAGESFPLSPRAASLAFFRTLGLAPALGRDFAPLDLLATLPPPAILSHQLWVSRFGGSATAASRSAHIAPGAAGCVGGGRRVGASLPLR